MTATSEFNLPSLLQDLLNKIAVQEGFSEYSLNTSSGSNHADGFLGIIIRVTIKGVRNKKPDELSLIVKTAPENQIRREFASALVFNREIFIYNEFLPAIDKFQKEKGLTPETGFFCYPKCYGTIADHDSFTYCLVLEDLKESGYGVWNKLGIMELDQVELVVKQYAKLHAVSFALRDQRPELIEKFLHMTDTLVPLFQKEEMAAMFNITYDKAIASLDPSEEEARAKLIELKESIRHLEFCVSKENAEPFVVINHGDSWSNNLMFSYKDEKKLDKVCFIDWQISRAASPVLDFLYFFFTSAQKPLRDQHYDRVLRTYYDALATSIRRLGSDPDKLFTFDNFQEHLKKFGKFALIISVFLIQTITMDPKDIPDLDTMVEDMVKMDPSNWDFMNKSLDTYNKRMSELVRDLLALGYF